LAGLSVRPKAPMAGVTLMPSKLATRSLGDALHACAKAPRTPGRQRRRHTKDSCAAAPYIPVRQAGGRCALSQVAGLARSKP
jgi:hypothetical protein